MRAANLLDRIRTIFQAKDTEDTQLMQDVQTDAEHVADILVNEFRPESVFHIGCGIGRHMKPLLDAGIDTYGVDRSPVAQENAVVPEEHITVHDLENTYAEDVYDLVMCFEPFEAAPDIEQVIDTIAATGKIAVVSTTTTERMADAPEHTKEDLVEQFQAAGLQHNDNTSERLADEIASRDIEWAPKDLMVFHNHRNPD